MAPIKKKKLCTK